MGGLFYILWHYLDEPTGIGRHGGQPHHLWVVFAQALRSLNVVFLALKFGNNVILLRIGVGKPGLFLAGYLKQGRLSDVDVTFLELGDIAW